MKKKFLAALLSLCMVLALLPVTALADDPADLGSVLGNDFLNKMNSTLDDSVADVSTYAKQTASVGEKGTDDVYHVTITLALPDGGPHVAEVAGTPVAGVGLQGINGKFKAKWVPAFIPKPDDGYTARYGQFAGEYSGWQTLSAEKLADSRANYEMDWFQAGYPGYYLAEYTPKNGQSSTPVKVCYDVKFEGDWRTGNPPTITAKAMKGNKISVKVENPGANSNSLRVYFAKDKTYTDEISPLALNDGSTESEEGLGAGTYTLLLVDTEEADDDGVLGELLGIAEVILPAPVIARPNAEVYKDYNDDTYANGPWRQITLTLEENNTIKVKADGVQKHPTTGGDAPEGYWVGIGVARAVGDNNTPNDEQTDNNLYDQDWGEGSDAISSVPASKPDGYYQIGDSVYATFYFDLSKCTAQGYTGFIKAGSVVYTVDFTGSTLASSDATLSSLTYAVGSSSAASVPEFSGTKTQYSVELPYGTAEDASITVTGTKTNTYATVTSPSTITLSGGIGSATVTVTAEDKTEKTYTINFTTASRPLSSDATLSALSYKIGSDTVPVPDFVSGTTSYTVELPADTANGTKIDLVGSPTDENASITANAGVTLEDGAGTAAITVTAEDGTTTETYRVTFRTAGHPLSSVAALSELCYKIGNNTAVQYPVPGFAAEKLSYNVELPADTAANAVIALVGTPDKNAVITANEGVTLVDGAGTASITVKSEDGKATKTYEVIFTTAKTEKPEEPGLTVANPVVDTEGLTGVTTEQKKDVIEAASSLQVTSNDGDPLEDAKDDNKKTVDELMSMANKADKAKAATDLNKLKGMSDVTEDEVVPVVVTCMNIKVTEYNPDNAKLTMEIKPQMMVVFTTTQIASSGETIEAGKNAVKLKDSERDVTLSKSKAVDVKITLPGKFVEAVKGAQIYVSHKTNGKTFEYKGELGSGNAFSFTNPHGFSPFEFTTETTSGAWIGKVGYENLSGALDEVTDKGKIFVVNSDTSGSTDRSDLTGKSFTILKSDETAWSGKVTINGVTYTPDANGKVTVTKPSGSDKPGGTGSGGGSGKPSVKPAETAPNAPTTPSGGAAGFSDVASGAWYAASVAYVVERKIMIGTGNGNFSPDAPTTRAMIMTMLARLNGVDTDGGSVWYEKGMQWAQEQGVSDGSNPNGNVTREQLVTMLYRYMNSPEAAGDLSGFADAAAVSDWAADAMKWAVANGLIQGSNGAINPTGNATRAEVATILMRFCESFSV